MNTTNIVLLAVLLGLIQASLAVSGSYDCKKTPLGQGYMGQVSVTQEGLTCQRWDQQTPHSHSNNNPDKFPDQSLAEASNYCRNPDSEPDGPWCYTLNGTRWQYCDVPLCDKNYNCKMTHQGQGYFGPVSVTKGGLTCQRWDHQMPHSHSINNPDKFPDQSLAEASNYCRNPDGSDVPWCYTMTNTRWQYCDIPLCEVLENYDCKMTPLGKGYMGQVSVTREGLTCQQWDQQTPHSHSNNNPDKFPDQSLAEASNYCRNPDGSEAPWCYTVTNTRWQYCDIPLCEKKSCPKCKDCKDSYHGFDYTGHLSVAKNGKECQRWDKQRSKFQEAYRYPEGNVTAAHNYCRNPDTTNGGPWCYTVGGGWNHCDIPWCAEVNSLVEWCS